MKLRASLVLAALLQLATAGVQAQAQVQAEHALVRASELRADKLPDAPVLRPLPAGTRLQVLSVEGSWAWVEAGGTRGWVRSAALPSAASAASAAAPMLSARNLPPRGGRHALIITVGRYADPQITALPGTRIDRDSATQMARTMQIPPENIRYLTDEQATGDAIRNALKELNARVAEGDRVYVHFSGHGTRFFDPQANGCVEALLAHDGGWPGTLTNRAMADLLAPISRKTDKMFVMYDSCHSGGVLTADPGMRTRGVRTPADEGTLRARFTPAASEECARPINIKTRNLLVESTEKGTLPQDIVHLSSSRENEISFDDELKGGLATQFLRDCMVRDGTDQDGSGALSIEELRVCAQQKMNDRLKNDLRFQPSTLVLSGNAGFVPAWFGAQQIAQAVAAAPPATAAAPPAPLPPVATPGATPPVSAPSVSAPPVTTPPVSAPPVTAPPVSAPPVPPMDVVAVAPPAPAAPPRLSGAQALRQLYDQRDGKRQVRVQTMRDKLRINVDPLEFKVESDRPGYVYVALAGSDNDALYVLFPNDLDGNNRVEAGKPLQLPRPNWRVRAAGPAGTDHLLVLVTDAPRDLAALPAAKAGPFIKSLNNAEGRASLGALMTRARPVAGTNCSGANRQKNLAQCSDAFGAAMVTIEEIR